MRKKAVHNLDTRQITMVENAYYYCNPPDRVAYVKVNKVTITKTGVPIAILILSSAIFYLFRIV